MDPMAPDDPSRPQPAWRGYAVAIGLVAASTAAAYGLSDVYEARDLDMVFLAGVLAAGALQGLRPALVAATLAFLAYNFLFLSPRYSLAIGSPEDLLTLVAFCIVALVSGGLAGRVRDQQRAALRRAAGIAALLAASRRLSGSATRLDAAQALADQLAAASGGPAQVLLPDQGEIAPVATARAIGAPQPTPLSVQDMAAARWAWEKGEAAGAGTATLPHADWTFRPLQGVEARIGVAAIAPAKGETDERFVLALLDQGAVALERAQFAVQAADAEALRQADRLRSALLNSISHDLRTPLSTVLGATTTLIEYGKSLTGKVQRDLLDSIREEAERLNRYVGDLLDMTRLEGGALVTRKDWIDLREVLGAAAARVRRRLGTRRIDRDFPAELTLVKADPGLMEQAVVNILENAIAYSPDGSAIEIAVYEDRGHVVISIEDQGRGIPAPDLERVFERFRRLEAPSDRGKGAGLGLAIAKGFVEAMGGRIAAASPIHEDRGTRILISLPKDRATPAYLL
jgi:two-component system sensor histidine kinase KdpD